MWRKIDGWWTRHSDGRRYDRGPMYLSVLVGLFLTAISMLLQGPTPTGPISAALDAASQTMLATSMLIGTGSMLFGSAAGARLFFQNGSAPVATKWELQAFPFQLRALLCTHGPRLLKPQIFCQQLVDRWLR